MARLNTRLSATPLHSRATTVDSLYRDPSAAPQYNSDERASTYSVISPSQSMTSDKENDQPGSRQLTPGASKNRALRGVSTHMPTPDSGSSTASNGSKRRRTGDYTMTESSIYQDEQDNDDDAVPLQSQGRHEVQGSTQFSTLRDAQLEEEGDLQFYNPNQDPDQRRRLRASMRDHARSMDENRDEMIKPNGKLLDALKMQNGLFGKVRQTADAALDSRFLVNASELAGKKLNNSLHGNGAMGIDFDHFISKCIYYMKSGGHSAGEEDAHRPRVANREDSEEEQEEEEDSDGLDWALLGRQACFPSNRRPPVSSFLLGPLSVRKRVRATQRRARSQRQPLGPATRPQEIKEGDIQQSENANLSHLVKSIKVRLQDHLKRGMDGVEADISEIPEEEDMEDQTTALLRRYRVVQAPSEEVAVSLLDFAINPHDFGQTVENLFYISFLIREGNAKIIKDEDGLPLIIPEQPHGVSDQREKNIQKHQAVFSIDYPTWQMFIEAYDIKEPLIPHREQEEANIGQGGWYTG